MCELGRGGPSQVLSGAFSSSVAGIAFVGFCAYHCLLQGHRQALESSNFIEAQSSVFEIKKILSSVHYRHFLFLSFLRKAFDISIKPSLWSGWVRALAALPIAASCWWYPRR